MGHHVAQSLPTESDTGMSAKKLMDEGALPAFTLEQVCRSRKGTCTEFSLHLALKIALSADPTLMHVLLAGWHLLHMHWDLNCEEEPSLSQRWMTSQCGLIGIS